MRAFEGLTKRFPRPPAADSRWLLTDVKIDLAWTSELGLAAFDHPHQVFLLQRAGLVLIVLERDLVTHPKFVHPDLLG